MIIKQKLTDFEAFKGDIALQGKIHDEYSDRAIEKGVDVVENEDLERQIKESGIISEKYNEPLSAEALMDLDLPDIEYLVEKLIPKGGKVIISGAAETFKSVFALNIASTLTTVHRDNPEIGLVNFLELKFKQAKVLYLDLEIGQQAIRQRLIQMIRGKSLVSTDLFINALPSINLLDKDSKKKLEGWLDKINPDLLIIDPFGCAWVGNENESVPVRLFLSYLNKIIKQYNLAVCLIHHWRKATDKANSGVEMAAGSYFLNAWAESHIQLKRNTDDTVSISQVKNRHGEKIHPFLAQLDDNLWLEKTGDLPGFGERKYATEYILELIGDSTNIAYTDIVKKSELISGAKDSTVRKLIRELISSNPEFSTKKEGFKSYLVRKEVT